MKIDVLDHGFVRLVSYMQPAPSKPFEIGGPLEPAEWSGDLEIVRNARVSYNGDWRTGTDEGSDDRLVRRLHARGHTTPFEAMVFTFEVKAPIFVFRQWHRHRTWSYIELSARYGVLPSEFYVPKPEHVGHQDPKEKQVRAMTTGSASNYLATDYIQAACMASFETYKQLLAAGVPRELARGVLPLNTYSRMFGTVDLHNLFHFLRLRMDSHAQWEIQQYANALLELISPVCPIAVEAFKETESENEE